ncbi:MAG: PEP-CTERM sorting domain-containing protein [Burkholderiales bacterium]
MKKVSALAVAAMASCLAGLAHADSVTYSGSFSGATDVTNQVIDVQQFNSSLGTLQSASFVLDATMDTSMFANNDGNFYAGWDKLQYALSLTGDTGYSNIAISASDSPARIVGTGLPYDSELAPGGNPFSISNMAHVTTSDPNNVYQNQSNGSGIGFYKWTFIGPTLSATQTFAQGADAAFIGSGNLNFFLTTQNYDSFSVAGTQSGGYPSSSQGLDTNILSTVSVTYTYAAPVPEAGSNAMMLAGLGLIAFMVLRRKDA